jgi:hypothetical protein
MPGGRHPASPGFVTKHLRLGSSSTNMPLSMVNWPPDFRRGVHLELASVVNAACQQDLPIWAASMSKTPSSSPRCSKPDDIFDTPRTLR